MGSLNSFKMLILFLFFLATAVMSQDPNPVDPWFRGLITRIRTPKTAVLQFYVQDVVSGPGQTVYEIARSSITATSPTSFGQLFMVDNVLTAGPQPNSTAIGRRQGLVGFADLNVLGLYLSFNFVFNGASIYNGSTLSIMGRSRLSDPEREVSIVGGTGVFRLARGAVVMRTFLG